MVSKFICIFSGVVLLIGYFLSVEGSASTSASAGEKEGNRNMMSNMILTGVMPSEHNGSTHLENQIVGTIPLIPTLKLGALSTLILPGLHFTLTVITIVFALIGIASFICAGYDCRSILRSDEISGFSQNFLPKNRHPLSHHSGTIGFRPWDAAPSIFQSLENSYSRYKDQRTEK